MKVRLEGLTVPSLVSELLTAMETLNVGWLFSLTVKVAVPPDSVVLPLMELMVNPAVLVVVSSVVVVVDSEDAEDSISS